MASTVPEVARFSKEYNDSCVTHLEKIKLNFSWKIDSLRGGLVEGIPRISPSFPVEPSSDFKFYLFIEPKVRNNKMVPTLWIIMEESPARIVRARSKVVMKNSSGLEIKGNGDWSRFKFFSKGIRYECPGFSSIEGLTESIPDDVITISFKLEISADITIEAENSVVKEPIDSEKDMAPPLGEPKCTVIVGGQKIQVDKDVLAARSSVFAEMFNSSENVQEPVTITDMDAAVFKELIAFIYTNKVENLDVFAYDLFAAADKYKLPKLKALCQKSILDILSVENAVKILLFAETHQAAELKTGVINFISSVGSRERLDILDSKDWKNLSELHPRLSVEAKESMTLNLFSAKNITSPSNNVQTGFNISGPSITLPTGSSMSSSSHNLPTGSSISALSNNIQEGLNISGPSNALPTGSNYHGIPAWWGPAW